MAYKNIDEVIATLKKHKYTDIKKVSGSKLIVNITSSARMDALLDIAKKLKGKHNPNGSGSSIGRTEIDSKYVIVVKTKGSSGSGGGAAATRLAESAQCVYCACKWNKKPYTQENLKDAVKNAPTDEKITNILKLDDDWIQSSIAVAEKLYDRYKSKKYMFHRGDKWVDTLENHWKDLNRKDNKFSNLNKWSPADIYMTTQKGRSVDITKTKNLLELNKLLLDNIKTQDIIGVSLKKVGKSVNFKELNFSNERQKYTFEDYSVGLKDFFASGDGFIFYDGGKIQFRRFGANWQGEIKGKFANMGKIGGGPIRGIMKDEFNIIMDPQRDIAKKTEKTMENFYYYYSHIVANPLTKKRFLEEANKKDTNWYISKYMTAQFLFHIEQLTKKKRDTLVSALLNYAGSTSALSAPYVKVY